MYEKLKELCIHFLCIKYFRSRTVKMREQMLQQRIMLDLKNWSFCNRFYGTPEDFLL